MYDRTDQTCHAPVFRECTLIEAIIVSVVGYMLIAVLFPFYRFPKVECLIKQFQFRIRYAFRGNDNPNIPL
jgi:hypothetical protein